MGQSTDGILFYGINFGEDEDERLTELIEYADEHWKEFSEIEKLHNVELGYHCSSDYPMYYVAHSDFHTRASRGYPEEIDVIQLGLAHIADRYKADISRFLAEFNIEHHYTEIKYYLVSYWG